MIIAEIFTKIKFKKEMKKKITLKFHLKLLGIFKIVFAPSLFL